MVHVLFAQDAVLDEPLRKATEVQLQEMEMKYYTPQVHKAAFCLPRFANVRHRTFRLDDLYPCIIFVQEVLEGKC